MPGTPPNGKRAAAQTLQCAPPASTSARSELAATARRLISRIWHPFRWSGSLGGLSRSAMPTQVGDTTKTIGGGLNG